jgi:uncharacterized protein (DUF2336 family)
VSASTDFRHIAEKHDAGRSDRLFRAAISAFCALTRPSRREIIQLEELCLQLYDGVSEESLRYVAAALSDIPLAPAALVRRLADERIEIAAPLLLKSAGLSEIDLVAIIGRNGATHARVIAQRKSLTKPVATLVEKAGATVAARQKPGEEAERTREALRGLMRPSRLATQVEHDLSTPSIYEKLRETALTGSLPFFQTALADALEIEYKQARSLVIATDKRDLARALKALGLSQEQAFLLVSATFPAGFGHPQAIRDFLQAYEAISAEEAVAAVRLHQADAVFSGISERLAGNGNDRLQPKRGSQVA